MLNALNKPLPVGFFFVALALVVNEWTAAWMVSGDGTLELPNRVLVRAAQALALGCGLALLFFRVKVSLNVILFNVVFFGLLLLCVEGGLFYLLHRTPEGVSSALLQSLKAELYNSEKEFIQFRPECARHDDALGYTLRPGTCNFSGAEFSTEFRINSLGLRDDESSLEAPEIIVLGDSYAMGWGVGQEDTFAEALAARTGKKVLNGAVSSYGTARQVLNLERLDTSRLETLVIQYCHNDFAENEAFLENDGQLRTMQRGAYERWVETHRAGREYFLGKYLVTLAKTRAGKAHRLLARRVASLFDVPLPEPPTAADEAQRFLDVLATTTKDLAATEIIVFELGPRDVLDGEFVQALESARASPPLGDGPLGDGPLGEELDGGDHDGPGLEVKTLDMASILEAEHFYPLDGHIDAKGHAAVAAAILEVLGHADAGAPPGQDAYGSAR